MDNLINIKCLDSENIIKQLDIRYSNDTIYTKIDNILIAVNPFKKINKQEDKPHPDFIADTMIKGIVNHNKNQSVLISGESGAGKTETTKILLNRLLDNKSNHLGEMIIASNIILESFGNASTIRNHNSSRFGKLITLIYNHNYNIVGAEVKTYLLEKIRVTDKDICEKNFHIFYLLNDIRDNILVSTTSETPDLFDGPSTLKSLYDSFKIFEMDQYIDSIKDILKIIIYLSSYQDNIDILSRLLKISEKDLVQCIEKQMISVGGETIYKNLSENEIKIKLKTLSQELYSNLFDFIVLKINQKLKPSEKSEGNLNINLLDIFGFEILNHNSIEQLCINYTNEILQNEFNQYFFEKEQQLYLSEGLPYDLVDFKNNDDIINCIEKKIFGVINEVTRFIKPKDKMIIDKFNKLKNELPYLKVSNLDRGNNKFRVQHYASEVTYESENFISKNNLNLSLDIINLINKSQNTFINLFNIKSNKNLLLNNFYKQIKQLKKVINSTEVNFIRCLKPNDSNIPNNLDYSKVEQQLTYNGIIEAIAIVRQGYPIRYSNLEFDKVFKIVPNKFKENIIRGKTLTFMKAEEEIELLEIKQNILDSKATLISKIFRGYSCCKKFNIIKTKVIIIQKYSRRMIALVHFIRLKSIIRLQAIIRKYNARKLFIYLKSIVRIQSLYRKYNARKLFIYLKSIVTIQSLFRMIKHQKKYQNLISKVTIIQNFIRQKISTIEIQQNAQSKMLNQASNIIIRLFKYQRFCKFRKRIIYIGRQNLHIRRLKEEQEREKLRLLEIEKQKILHNISLMEEEDYLARRLRDQEKNKEIEKLNRQNLQNALLIDSLNTQQQENINVIEHLNKEKDELLQAIAQKDIMLLQKIARLEENLHSYKNKEENKCTIM